MKTNIKVKNPRKKVLTGGGAITFEPSNEQALRRLVLTCLLWEDGFYIDGITVAEKIQALIPKVKPDKVVEIAIKARIEQKLRHIPLFIAREMARHETHKGYVSNLLPLIIERADELSEFLSIYWKQGKCPISSQVKKGLASAFKKFDEYALSKYKKTGAISLKDVLFLCHAKPDNKAQEKLWKKLIDNKLETPDTWEVELSSSAGVNKKDSWERLLKENKLGALALIRNLRNMEQAGVDTNLISKGLLQAKVDRVLPFRFVAAANHAPRYESELEQLMFKCLENKDKIPGKTILVVDISGSMGATLSSKSENNRLDTACALAMLARESCEKIAIYATAGNDGTRIHATDIVAPRRGFALREAIKNKNLKLGGGGIFLSQVIDYIREKEKDADRVIILSDSQDCDVNSPPNKAKVFAKNNYLIDISCEQYGIAYDKFLQINGWSENVLDYIRLHENYS